jgi:hypothetical protein
LAQNEEVPVPARGHNPTILVVVVRGPIEDFGGRNLPLAIFVSKGRNLWNLRSIKA